jgi:rhodanese-related sulfurtransferase
LFIFYHIWKKEGYPLTSGAKIKISKTKPTTVMSKSGAIKKGLDSGTVDGKWFVANYKNLPSSVTIVDVRDPKSYQKGHLKGAINIEAAKMKPNEFLNSLPKSGDVVFYCGTGTRAMEARGFIEETKYNGLDRIFYLDANIECKGNDCKIVPNEPIGI